jgi:hypothetical protein
MMNTSSRCALRFVKVVVRKPDASRDESAEQYMLARGLRTPPGPSRGLDIRVIRPNFATVAPRFTSI